MVVWRHIARLLRITDMREPGKIMERIRVLVAEDEEAVREALVDLLSSDAAIEVVGAAKDTDEAIQMAIDSKPDVALVDVKMPGGGGARAAREILINSPQTHVVALSAYEDRRTVLEMLRAGVVGYVVKGTSADEILRTVRRSLRGQGSLSVEVTADVIHELVALLDRSEALSRELQELDRTKSELIQIMSHELFTPMTTIQGFAMLVSDQGEALKVDEVRDLADGVMRASDRLKRLVGNLEAAARLDRAGVEVATRPMAAMDLVLRVLSEFPRFAERIVTPDALVEPEVRLWADLELGARALIVVVENALAFSGESGMVEISIQPIEGDVRVTVSDHGLGVPEELRDRIFDAFTQTDGSITRSHEGLGIGLFLARRIMRAHGGDLTYAPRPGGGSSFTLSFPGFGVPAVEAQAV
jgi:signal transduction histidine kinase